MLTTQAIRDQLSDAAMISGKTEGHRAVDLRYLGTLSQGVDQVTSAQLLCTAHGIYEAAINGQAVDDSVMAPGWTSYEWRLQVKHLDVTDLVRTGKSKLTLEVLLGNGWYRGGMGFEKQGFDYGDQIGFVAVLEISYADGASQRIATSADPASGWRAYESPVRDNSLYMGETIDARIDRFSQELPLVAVAFDPGTLIAQEGPDVTRHEVLRPVAIWDSPSGKTLVDFGQNITGWLRFSVQGERGDKIVLRHAEVLDKGELGTRPLREAKATDVLVCSDEKDFFEPTLTSHGFRYAEVTGWPGELAPDDLEAVAISSKMERTGFFTCSNADVNQLVSNSVWSQRDNFVDIPTDCPQRDERLGWTGDIAAYAPTASFQYDTRAFLHKWLMDLTGETDHSANGLVPILAPDIVKYAPMFPNNMPTAIWGDAAVWVPEALWNAYGEKDQLAAHYPGMCLHLRSIERVLSPEGLWDQGFQFGDWLDPDADPEDPAAAKADCHVIAQACLYRDASFAARAAEVLEKDEDAAHWKDLANRVRTAFNEHYVEGGIVKSDCTAVYALALHFGLLEGEDRAKAADRLAELVRASGYRVTTGFAGTPYITWALSENGHAAEAYRLLLEPTCPSWLYPVGMGATTIWERWDSLRPDGTINPGGMTSFNHYALGAVCDWIYQVIGGIRAEEPGYARVRIAPVPGEGITWARCAFVSTKGRIETSWQVRDEQFRLEASIPDGVPAIIELPSGKTYEVVGGVHRFGEAAPMA